MKKVVSIILITLLFVTCKRIVNKSYPDIHKDIHFRTTPERLILLVSTSYLLKELYIHIVRA